MMRDANGVSEVKYKKESRGAMCDTFGGEGDVQSTEEFRNVVLA